MSALKQIFSDVKPSKVSKIYCELCAYFPLVPVQNDGQIRVANKVIDGLVDFLNGDHGKHELEEAAKYLAVLSDLVRVYEAQRFDREQTSPREVLAYLMDSNGLRQSDLRAEIGPQSVVSEILVGRRRLNVVHIQKLSRRFKVRLLCLWSRAMQICIGRGHFYSKNDHFAV